MVLHCNRSPSCFSHSMLLQLTVTPPRKWKLAQTFREKTLSPSPLLSALLFAGLLSLSSSILLKAPPPHTHTLFLFFTQIEVLLSKMFGFCHSMNFAFGDSESAVHTLPRVFRFAILCFRAAFTDPCIPCWEHANNYQRADEPVSYTDLRRKHVNASSE